MPSLSSPRVLLCNPKQLRYPVYTVIPNIGLGYLAAALKREGYKVTILDCQKENLSPQDCAKYAEEKQADVVGFSSFSSFFASTRSYLKAVKQRLPAALTLLGGVHSIFEPQESLTALPEADYGFCGESDSSLPLFLNHYFDSSLNPPQIPNLIYRENGSIVVTERKELADLSCNPLPAWELVQPTSYPAAPNGIFSRAEHIAPIITTRGCPYPCTFCGAGKASGKQVRTRTLEVILAEICWLQEMGIQEIHIMDDNFTFKLNFAKSFCHALLKENIRIHWALPNGVRLDRLDQELLELMEASGCYSMAVGIEAGTESSLKRIQKRLTLETIRQKLALIKSCCHIRVTGFFIIGYPGESAEDVAETIRFACSLPIQRANFFNFTPFPGSPIYHQLKQQGKLKGIPMEDLYIHRIVYSNGSISREELKRLQRKAHLSFYLRYSILKKILKEIQTLSQLKILLLRIKAILLPD